MAFDFLKCMEGEVAANNISEGQFRQLEKAYNKKLEKVKASTGDENLAKEAAEQVAKDYFTHLKRVHFSNQVHAVMVKRVLSLNIEPKDFKRKLNQVLENTYLSSRANEKIYADIAQDFFVEYAPGSMGSKGKTEGVEDIIRARYGEEVSDKGANKHGQALAKMIDTFRQDWNARGGIMDEKINFMPSDENADNLVRYTLKEYKEDLLKHNDINVDDFIEIERRAAEKAGHAYTQGDIDAVLDRYITERYNLITSEGLYKPQKNLKEFTEEPKSRITQGRVDFGDTFNHFRRVTPKNAESYIFMSNKYGHGVHNFYDTMTNYVKKISSRMATLHSLGPKVHEVEQLAKYINSVNQKVKIKGKKIDSFSDNYLSAAFNEFKGGLKYIKPESTAERVAMGFLDILPMSMLGNVAIASIPDLASVQSTKKLMGFRGASSLKSIYKAYIAEGFTKKEMAHELNHVLDTVDLMNRSIRYEAMDTLEKGIKRGGNIYTRLTGMRAWHERLRLVGADMFHSAINLEKKTEWKNLDPVFRNAAERVGIDEAGWDKIRSTKPVKDGVDRITPLEVKNTHGHDLAIKYGRMMVETERLVLNDKDLKAHLIETGAAITGGTGKGGFAVHAGSRAFWFLRRFPLHMLLNVFGNSFKHLDKKGAVGNIAAYMGISTVLSIFAIELKLLTQGEHQSVSVDGAPNPELLKKAMSNSVMGMLAGDIVLSSFTNQKTETAAKVIGPAFSMILDIAHKIGKPVNHVVQAVVENDYSELPDNLRKDAAEASRLMKQLIPIAKLPYTTYFINKAFDFMEENLHEESYLERLDRKEQRLEKEGIQTIF